MRARWLSVACVLGLGCTAVTGAEEGMGAEVGVDGDLQLPGDIDNAAVGGKSDAWDSVNDPRRLSRRFNYRIEELPKSGKSEHEAWADSYWPTYEGSTNHRWQGADVLSPLEKYDAAIHGWTPATEFADLASVPTCGPDAHAKYSKYVAALGPAAKWTATSQGRADMFDGVDSDGDGQVDECGSDYDGIETWWGLCHAWAPAAVIELEPQHAVEYQGQTFEVSDIKALILTAYDDTQALMLGGRCNAKELERDDQGRIVDAECRDTNAGAFHVVITNMIGLHKQGLVEDRTANYEVWNQPLIGYEVTRQEEVTQAKAIELLGLSGAAYTPNARAKRFIEVELTTSYVTESSPSRQPVGIELYTRHDSYHYLLEVDARGKIIGGEWLDSSRDNHPDFLWSPVRANESRFRSSNPHVELATVRTLLELSRR